MLQIATGRFFATERSYETMHRGVFYTNYRAPRTQEILLPHGRLLPSTGFGGSVATITYEITEKMEWEAPAPGVMVSTGGRELVNDFADVLSFRLRVTCSTDFGLVGRLVGRGGSGSAERRTHAAALGRIFDAGVMEGPDDAVELRDFLENLVSLSRAPFETAMRAIRRYVAATHRTADDVSLAYALFVMSIEALAQGSKLPAPGWDDYDEAKRRKIDGALDGAPRELADKVRSVILANEHVALSRRFQDFALGHLSSSFFREEAAGRMNPVSRMDLPRLLARAYGVRSKYVHRLEGLEPLLADPVQRWETLSIDGQPTLTLEGLARLARHVILNFVERGQRGPPEAFDWRGALPNVVRLPVAPQYWIWNPTNYGPKTAVTWLQAFMTQVTALLARESGAALTDLGQVLDRIEVTPIAAARPEQRRAMVVLYQLFLALVGPNRCQGRNLELNTGHPHDFDEPSVGELCFHLGVRNPLRWSVDELETMHRSYHETRHRSGALSLGAALEGVFTLSLAEACRLAERMDRARELVSFAVEAAPGHAGLLTLESSCRDAVPMIDPYEVMFGKPSDTHVGETPTADVAGPQNAAHTGDGADQEVDRGKAGTAAGATGEATAPDHA